MPKVNEIEPELRKRYLLQKYRNDIDRIAMKVFDTWTKEAMPLLITIVKDEELDYLEAWLLIDTILLETVKTMLETHRRAENRAYEEVYLESGGDESGNGPNS